MKALFAKGIGLTLLLSLLLLSGCGVQPNEALFQAEQKTFQTETGRMEILMRMDGKVTVMKEGKEEKVDWPVKEVLTKVAYDAKKELSLTQNRTTVEDIGYEMKFYQDGMKTYILSPLFPKILVIDQASWKASSLSPEEVTKLQRLGEQLKERWLSLLQRENAAAIGDELLSTPNGEVKVKKYRINLSAEGLRSFLLDSLTILGGSEAFQKVLDQSISLGDGTKTQFSIPSLDEIKERVEKVAISPLHYYAYIDRDGYVIDENLELTLDGIHINLHLTHWDLGKPVEITLPKVTKENSIPVTQEGMKELWKLPTP